MLFPALLVFALLHLASAEDTDQCGYQSCPKIKADRINLHLVAHTHDDVGWLKTYDQYYYGSNNSIQDAGVQYILDSVVQELLHDPNKRFIYVETAYFWKWWRDQHDHIKHVVKRLVRTGRLEIIGGGWSMNDEATTHYQSIIDQFSWGFRRLNAALGPCGRPRIGWQIDPFGHSRENAAIMAKLGFDGLFLGRIDWEDKSNRMKNKSMEMIWHADPFISGNDGKLFTGILYNTYDAPKGFCFDILCTDEPLIDNKGSPLYNIERRATEFLNIMKNYTKAYKSKNIIVTMGEDFTYQSAHVNFKNMDKLIKQINSQSDTFFALYSTPSCYLKSVHDEGLTFPIKEDDFLPYSSDPYAFWTGYFTSRPTIKKFERMGNNFLQIVKQASVISEIGDSKILNELREAMGVMQHHDAVTGTEKQHVAADYARILTSAINNAQSILEEAIGKIMKQKDVEVKIESCLLLNISSCSITSENNGGFVVTVYNTLSRHVNHLVRVPISSNKLNYTVKDPSGNELVTQILVLPDAVTKVPGRPTESQHELVWLAENIAPVGYTSYHITPQQTGLSFDLNIYEEPFLKKSIAIGQDLASITLSGTGDLKGVKMGDQVFGVDQGFHYYLPAVGDNKKMFNRSSGAYIFRPNGSSEAINNPKVKIFNGPLVTEVHQTFNSWVSHVIRCIKGSDIVEFEWLVGPIPVEEERGKEIVWRFTIPGMKTAGKFETDSNGRQTLQRQLFYRKDWPVNLVEKIPGNYYPITTHISISDDKHRITVITDRAQGSSSLKEGEIEIMIHRRLTHDDAFGVEEALNETAFGEGLVARGTFWLTSSSLDVARQKVQEKSVLPPWLLFSPTSLTYDQWKTNFNMEFQAISKPLPPSVQILTLEPWTNGTVLLRLEHTSPGGEEVNISFENLFTNFKITGVEEMTIDGNKKISEVNRFEWKEELGNSIVSTASAYEPVYNNFTLKEMQIRTFVLQTSPLL